LDFIGDHSDTAFFEGGLEVGGEVGGAGGGFAVFEFGEGEDLGLVGAEVANELIVFIGV